MRREVKEISALLPPLEGVECLPLDAGGIAALSFAPALAAARRMMLYLHGGGFAVGSGQMHRDNAGRAAPYEPHVRPAHSGPGACTGPPSPFTG
jgi:acetyl esterase/lipase